MNPFRRIIADILIPMILVSVLLGGCTSLTTTPGTSPTQFLYPGDEARLFVKDIEQLFVAIDEDIYEEFRKVIDIKDAYGMAELFQAGKIFEVNNSRVLLIERGTTFAVTTRWKVRVLEGPAVGQAGWVHHSWIKSFPD